MFPVPERIRCHPFSEMLVNRVLLRFRTRSVVAVLESNGLSDTNAIPRGKLSYQYSVLIGSNFTM